jgi:type II secretory pathway component GspD/PulD (secretin)
MRHRRAVATGILIAVALALAGLASGGARAQRATEPVERLVSLDFDGEITDLIDLMARITNQNFVYDDRVRGRVTVVTPTPIPVDQAHSIFESALQVKGFTAVTTPGGAVKVIPLRDARSSNIETRTSGYPPPGDDVDDLTRNCTNLSSQARILPEYADGEMVGLQINAIRPGSLFEAIGIQNGDVITQLNGISIDDPENSAKILAEFSEAESFSVVLTRKDGSSDTLEFNVGK